MKRKDRPYYFEEKRIRLIYCGRAKNPALPDRTFWATKPLRHNAQNDRFKFKAPFRDWLREHSEGRFEVVRVTWHTLSPSHIQFRFAIQFATDEDAIFFKMAHG